MSETVGFTERFKRLRIAFLLCILVGVVAWHLDDLRWHKFRNSWQAPLRVEVFLLEHGAVSAKSVRALRTGIPRLERLLQSELSRYRPGAPAPFSFFVHETATIDRLPPEPPNDQDLLARTEYFLELRDYLSTVHRRTGATPQRRALQLYVILEPTRTRERFAEGFGTFNGDLGVVHTSIDDRTVDQALLALSHELLHCLGATDKYDESGHAIEPAGLAEPDRVPWYPQRYGEPMVGEVSTGPGQGRLLNSLSEARIGPATAAELGWISR